MRYVAVVVAATIALGATQQVPASGPYKVLQAAKVGGEGGWDYIYADSAGRRLYIPRRGAPPAPARLTIFNLDTLEPLGEIEGIGGNGTAVDPASGHGFTSSKPVAMFDTRTLKPIKTIDVGAAQPDGILFDGFNQRVYVFSHPTKDATVIDAKDGTVLGTIDLGGVPEQGVADGKGRLYVVMQDSPGSVTVVDAAAMKATAHYPFNEKGARCNGLALDAKNGLLFAACGNSGNPPPQPARPSMIVMRAGDGRVLSTLPLTGGSDGAAFNPDTLEAFATLGNGTLAVVKEQSGSAFALEQNLPTMNGARTIAFDGKTGRVFTMADEREPATAGPGNRGPVIPGSFTILMIGK